MGIVRPVVVSRPLSSCWRITVNACCRPLNEVMTENLDQAAATYITRC